MNGLVGPVQRVGILGGQQMQCLERHYRWGEAGSTCVAYRQPCAHGESSRDIVQAATIDTYLRAWMDQDPDLIVTIFTADAIYHERVLEEPIRTREVKLIGLV